MTQASLSAKNATGTISIIMVAVTNPVDSSLIVKGRLPAVSGIREYAEAGYSCPTDPTFPNFTGARQRTWIRLSKGAKPADIPVERATKFELVIDLKTAKQIGLTIPPEVLAGANRLMK